MSGENGTRPKPAPWSNRMARRLVGFGLWLATDKAHRAPFEALDALALGSWAIGKLNAAMQADELARRHAKPSSRRRVV